MAWWGKCALTPPDPYNPVAETAPGFNPRTYQVKKPGSEFLSNATYAATAWGTFRTSSGLWAFTPSVQIAKAPVQCYTPVGLYTLTPGGRTA